AEVVAKAFVICKRLQLAQLAQVGDPSFIDRVADCPSECGIGQKQPAPWRDAVGSVRSDDSQVGHTHVFVRALSDKAHTRQASFVAWEPGANVVEQPAID